MYIYCITNTVNGQQYIGKTTKDLFTRFRQHKYNSRYGSKTHLHRSFRKHGEDKFTIEIIEETTFELLNEREIYWINKLSPKYNMTVGGDGATGIQHSENFKRAMKEMHSKRKPEDYATYGMLGKTFPESAKKKVGKANSYAVVCDGMEFPSISEADNYFRSIGTPKSVRRRIDSDNHPTWYRLRPKRVYKKK